MIDGITAPEVRKLAEKRRAGYTIKSLVTASNIPQHRLSRYLRLYDQYGEGAFVPERQQLGHTKQNNRELRRIMKAHNMTRGEVAELLDAPHNTVKNWLRGEEAKGYNTMPAYALELLKIKVEGPALSSMREAKD